MVIVDKQGSEVLTAMRVRVAGQGKVDKAGIADRMVQTELTVLTERVVGLAGVDNKDKKVQKVSPVKTVILAGLVIVGKADIADRVVIAENRALMVLMV